MPSSEYISEVETVNTQANIIICSNNLYDNKDMSSFNAEYKEDDYIKCEYDNTSGTSTIFKNFFTNDSKLIKPNKDYWVILEVKEVKGTGKFQLLYDSANIQLSGWQDLDFSILTAGKIIVKKVTSNANSNNANTLLRTYCYFSAGQSGSITFRISISPIEVTAENFKYVPHLVQTKVVDIQQEMLQGDYFVKEEDGWKEVHLWNKKIFDGTENISITNNGNSFSYLASDILANTNINKVSEIFSNCYRASSWNDRNTNNTPNTISYYNIAVGIYKGDFATVEEFKADLAQKYTEGNPVYVWYKLATPTKLACTEKQNKQLDDLLNTSTYKNVTHIYSTDKVSPIIKIKYRKDIETMFNTQQSNYDTRLSNIEKLLATTTTSAMLLDNLQTDIQKEVM